MINKYSILFYSIHLIVQQAQPESTWSYSRPIQRASDHAAGSEKISWLWGTSSQGSTDCTAGRARYNLIIQQAQPGSSWSSKRPSQRAADHAAGPARDQLIVQQAQPEISWSCSWSCSRPTRGAADRTAGPYRDQLISVPVEPCYAWLSGKVQQTHKNMKMPLGSHYRPRNTA